MGYGDGKYGEAKSANVGMCTAVPMPPPTIDSVGGSLAQVVERLRGLNQHVAALIDRTTEKLTGPVPANGGDVKCVASGPGGMIGLGLDAADQVGLLESRVERLASLL